MTIRILSGTAAAVALGFTVGLAAQTPSTAQTGQSGAQRTMTITGCIERAAQAPTGTSGTAGATRADDTKFMLTNAMMSPTGSGAAGTTGTASSTSTAAAQYRLDADDAKLMPHVGHKVEITGTVEQASSTTSSASAPTGTTASKLKVDSVRMVAATCP